jgi:hypothetical protein
MEPSGRNPWQPVANGTAARTAQQAKTAAAGCDRLPETFHGQANSVIARPPHAVVYLAGLAGRGPGRRP